MSQPHDPNQPGNPDNAQPVNPYEGLGAGQPGPEFTDGANGQQFAQQNQPYGTQGPAGQPPTTPGQPQAQRAYPGQPNGQSGQPYGQPGQPNGQPGQPNGQPYQPTGQPGQPWGQPNGGTPQGEYPFQSAPAPKRFGVRSIISIIVAAAVLGAGGYFVWKSFTSAVALQAGNCIVISGDNDSGDLEHRKVDCEDSSVYSYKIVEVSKGAADCADELPYEMTSTGRYSSQEKTDKTSCLIPNFHAGVCYDIVDADILSFNVSTECGSGSIKVTKVEDAATATCEAPAEPLISFARANKSFCAVYN